MATSTPPSPAGTFVQELRKDDESTSIVTPGLTVFKRNALLSVFCLAQFLDTFNVAALFSGIPTITAELGMSASEATWIISAFQLTFAAFLLVSGKITDVYNPKWAFVGGGFALASISLGTGFVNDKIALIVLRALAGISGSMTIPSALSMLVHVITEEAEQARALSIFGGFAAMGNVLGLVIGAILVQYASWQWLFWFVAIAAYGMTAAVITLAPSQPADDSVVDGQRKASKLRRLDIPGVSILTAALILLIFAVTSGTTSGWGSVMVLAPLIISVAAFIAFFFYESRLPKAHAAIPSEMWFYKNFSVLFGVALFPFLWWNTVFTTFATLWQEVYHWSIISTAVRLLPIGGMAFIFSFSSGLAKFTDPKYLIIIGHVLLIPATVVLAFADEPSRYASYTVPGFIIGSSGGMLIYVQTNIAIFRTAPSSMAGTVGAIFNSAIQVGSAVGLAAVTSIQISVDNKLQNPEQATQREMFRGRQASFWFLLALVVLELISVAVFYRLGQGDGKVNPTAAVKCKENSEPKRSGLEEAV